MEGIHLGADVIDRESPPKLSVGQAAWLVACVVAGYKEECAKFVSTCSKASYYTNHIIIGIIKNASSNIIQARGEDFCAAVAFNKWCARATSTRAAKFAGGGR